MDIFILIIVILAICILTGMNTVTLWKWLSSGKKTSTTKKIVENTSIIGKSHFKLRHKTPNNAKQTECEEVTEKEHNFVDEQERTDPGLMEIDLPSEEEDESTDEYFEEDIPLDFEYDPLLASGSTIEELSKTHQVIESGNASRKDEEAAGKVLYENQATELFDKAATDPKRRERISNLIDIYIELQDSELISKSPKRGKKTNSKIADFDINDFM